MKTVLKDWFERYLSDPEAVLLALLLLLAGVFITTTLSYLAPVFAGLIIAYLLEGMVGRLELMGVKHWLSVTVVYLIFMGSLVIILFWLAPLFFNQLSNFATELPAMLGQVQGFLQNLPERYPEFISSEQMTTFITNLKQSTGRLGQSLVSFSLASIPSLITLMVFLILVPLVVLFFMLDRDKITSWITRLLPEKRDVMRKIWHQIDLKLGNYVRGKVLEILIVSVATYIPFALFGVNYTFLLSILVGLSVLIPFIGVTIVTIPVIIVAYLQFGWGPAFIWIMIIYTIITVLDANLLVPLLFSEAVNLHPIIIITAILFFGGIWGFWGVFFAIPLASIIQAVLETWPQRQAT